MPDRTKAIALVFSIVLAILAASFGTVVLAIAITGALCWFLRI